MDWGSMGKGETGLKQRPRGKRLSDGRTRNKPGQ